MTVIERPISDKVERLSTASARRVIEPDADIPGHIGPGQIIPDDLLSVAGLDLDLTDDQKVRLSREEVGSITTSGVIFEAVLEAGFALQITRSTDLTDPRVTFLLHEVGEETRHQRMFIRMLEDLRPTAVHPLDRWSLRAVQRFAIARFIQKPALLYTLVLGGEEIPDLIQKKAAEHPDTDPFIKEVNRYHRQEEARHLSFARAVLPEVWSTAGRIDRFLVRRVAPLVIGGMFDMLVHPGVYETVGLPGWDTWKAVKASKPRVELRQEATRPVLRALLEAGALQAGRIPGAWRALCGVDRAGDPT
jgi:P-aminobenzoate N-oxygenase AurF